MSPTTPPVPKPPAGSKVGLSKWLTGHKWEAGLGAAGIAATVYLGYRARQNSSSSSGTTSSTGASQALPVSTYTGGIGGGGGQGDYGDLGSVLTQLQSELGDASSASSGSSVEGSWSGASAGSDSVFDPVSAGSVIPNGVQLFYEPVAGSGVFDPAGAGLPTGTDYYVAPNTTQPTGFQQGNNNPGTQVVP
jgi:hypothetical protein